MKKMKLMIGLVAVLNVGLAIANPPAPGTGEAAGATAPATTPDCPGVVVQRTPPPVDGTGAAPAPAPAAGAGDATRTPPPPPARTP